MDYSSDYDLQDQLSAWGSWVSADGNGLGYSNPMARLMRDHAGVKKKPRFRIFISDDDALSIEKHITKLCKYKPLEGRVLMLKYVGRMSNNAIAKYYLTPLKHGKDSDRKVSAHKVASHLAYAEGFLIASIIAEEY